MISPVNDVVFVLPFLGLARRSVCTNQPGLLFVGWWSCSEPDRAFWEASMGGRRDGLRETLASWVKANYRTDKTFLISLIRRAG